MKDSTKKLLKTYAICAGVGLATGSIIGLHLLTKNMNYQLQAQGATIDKILKTLQSEEIINGLTIGK